jgi:hypothetical protein
MQSRTTSTDPTHTPTTHFQHTAVQQSCAHVTNFLGVTHLDANTKTIYTRNRLAEQQPARLLLNEAPASRRLRDVPDMQEEIKAASQAHILTITDVRQVVKDAIARLKLDPNAPMSVASNALRQTPYSQEA